MSLKNGCAKAKHTGALRGQNPPVYNDVNQQLFHFFIAKDYILLNVETHLMEVCRIEQFNKSKRTISVQTPPPPPSRVGQL
jgi:hypothetical protein